MLKKLFIPFLAVSFLLIGCNGADEDLVSKRPGANPQPPVVEPDTGPALDPTKLITGIEVLVLNEEVQVGGGVTRVDFKVENSDGDHVPNKVLSVTLDRGDLLRSFTDSQAQPQPFGVITNSNGEASVFVKSGELAGSATLKVSVDGVIREGIIIYTPTAINAEQSNIDINPANLPANGISTTEVTVTLRDQFGNRIIKETSITLELDAGSLLSPATQDSQNGQVVYQVRAGQVPGVATLRIKQYPSLTANLTFEALDVLPVNTLSLTPLNPTIQVGGQVTRVDLSATNSSGQAAQNKPLRLLLDSGRLFINETDALANTNALNQPYTLSTNAQGMAQIYVRSAEQSGTATLRASVDGVNQTASITYSQGAINAAQSSIGLNPANLPADGTSTTEVTVTLRDQFGNLIDEASLENNQFRLLLSLGQVVSKNPTSIANGVLTYTIQAPSDVGETLLSLSGVAGLSQTLSFVRFGSNKPANLTVNISNQNLFVQGVGKQDTSIISVTVRDSSGNLIDDPEAGVNNLTVSFKTQPSGSKPALLSGINATGDVIESENQILIRTSNGIAFFTLLSGRSPGVVEINIQATGGGETVNVALSEINIASGPAHSISFSYPINNAVESIGEAVYRRRGMVLVNDVYGNAVPDNTVVNLGLIDSVIISNGTTDFNDVNAKPFTQGEVNSGDYSSTAQIEQSNSVLIIGDGSILDNASIIRNAASRFVEPEDRVLLFNAQATDKLRRVISRTANEIVVNKEYDSDQQDLRYIIGAAEIGGSIAGNDLQGNLLQGQVRTENGIGTFYITYPANSNTLMVGCLTDPKIDRRYEPAGSAQVWVVAESNQNKATTLNNQGCFSPIAPLRLSGPGFNRIGDGIYDIPLLVTDANDIRVPYIRVGSTVIYDETPPGFNVSVTPRCYQTNLTDESGLCTMEVEVTAPDVPGEDEGSVTGTAEVIFSINDGATFSISVSVERP